MRRKKQIHLEEHILRRKFIENTSSGCSCNWNFRREFYPQKSMTIWFHSKCNSFSKDRSSGCPPELEYYENNLLIETIPFRQFKSARELDNWMKERGLIDVNLTTSQKG